MQEPRRGSAAREARESWTPSVRDRSFLPVLRPGGLNGREGRCACSRSGGGVRARATSREGGHGACTAHCQNRFLMTHRRCFTRASPELSPQPTEVLVGCYLRGRIRTSRWHPVPTCSSRQISPELSSGNRRRTGWFVWGTTRRWRPAPRPAAPPSGRPGAFLALRGRIFCWDAERARAARRPFRLLLLAD